MDALIERIARRVGEVVRSELTRSAAAVDDPEPLWDVKRVAKRLNVSSRTVEALVAKRELVPLRIGGQRRFDPRTVEAYLKRCAAPSGTATRGTTAGRRA